MCKNEIEVEENAQIKGEAKKNKEIEKEVENGEKDGTRGVKKMHK